MRKVIALAFTAVLLVSMVNSAEGKDKLRVLVDESRVYTLDPVIQQFLISSLDLPGEILDILDWSYSFDNILEPWGFGLAQLELFFMADLTIRKKGKLDYAVLRDYDVLIIAAFEEGYSTEEVEAIKKFVENGGGLLVLGDVEYPNNNISRAFDVLFYSESVRIADKKAESLFPDVHAIYVSDITEHPITEGIDEIAFYFGIPILSYKSGKSLIRTSADSWADREDEGFGTREDTEESGPFDTLVALENVGRGRAVFFGGSLSLWNSVTLQEGVQNLDLLSNAVEWLGEKGGPYRQMGALNEQAQLYLANGISLYTNHKFSEAKEIFEGAINFFEDSNEMYSSTEAVKGIEEARKNVEQCEIGIEADELFENASQLLENREYEKAIEEYENAKALYGKIEYTDQVEECSTQVDESRDWISLRDEAASLFEKAEDAFVTAPSFFSTTGYEQAQSLFEEARSTWQEYDDPDQMALCDEKIILCTEEIATIKQNRMIALVGVVAAVAVVVALVVTRMRKRKVQAEPVPEREEIVPEEEKGRIDLKALEEQYAKGEITKEEYEKKKTGISD